MEFRLDIRGTGNTFAVHLLDRDNTPLTDPSGTPLTRPIIPLDAEAEKVFGRIVEQNQRTTIWRHSDNDCSTC